MDHDATVVCANENGVLPFVPFLNDADARALVTFKRATRALANPAKEQVAKRDRWSSNAALLPIASALFQCASAAAQELICGGS
jgi:hypothetical protein